MSKYFIFLLIFSLSLAVHAQIGGESSFEFLSLPNSARTMSLGGTSTSVIDDDLSIAYSNPAVLNPSMHHQASFSTVVFPGGINHGHLAYARDFEKKGTYQAGLQYISYGQIARTDENGTQQGTFKPAETAFYGGGSKQIDKYSFGANVKFAFSQLDAYKSIALASDFGVTWHDTSKYLSLGLVLKNVGFQLKTYTPENRQSIPFDVQFGLSKRLKFIPFRINILAHNLFRWDVLYDDPNAVEEVNVFGGTESESKDRNVLDNLFRHFVFSGEFYIKEVFRLGFGYNHLRRKELSLSTKQGLTGVSFGFGFKLKQFRINYSLGKYHIGGTAHHFTLNAHISDFTKSK